MLTLKKKDPRRGPTSEVSDNETIPFLFRDFPRDLGTASNLLGDRPPENDCLPAFESECLQDLECCERPLSTLMTTAKVAHLHPGRDRRTSSCTMEGEAIVATVRTHPYPT